MNHPIMFLDRDNKTKFVPAPFSYFLDSYERKTNFNKKKTKLIERNIYIKIIVTIISKSLVTSSLSSLFCPFVEPKNKNQIFSKLVAW